MRQRSTTALTAALLCALALASTPFVGGQTRHPEPALTGVGEPMITSTDHSMRVEMPNGDILDLDFVEEPPILERQVIDGPRSFLKSSGCDPYMYRYAGYAPIDPASHASLGLPPIDADCDGRPDRPWYIERRLDWHSMDSRLGAVDMADVRAVIIRMRSRRGGSTTSTLFAAVDSDGEAIAGYVQQRNGEVWGEALVGRHGQGTVRYRLFAAADEPLSVAILESGSPFANGQVFDRAVVLTAAVEGGSGGTDVAAAIDGLPYNLGDAYAVEGIHTIEITVTSGSETASASATFTIDFSPPAFDQLVPPSGALLGAPTVTLGGLVSADAALVTVAGTPASLDSPAGEWRSFSSIPLVLVEGSNTLALHAEDGAGRTTDQEHHLVVDTLPPELAITSPPNGFVTGDPQLTVSGTVVDPHLQNLTVDGIGATFGGGSFTAALSLTEGANAITVLAADALGLTSEASLSVILDTMPPVLTVFESGTEFSDELLLGRPAVITVDNSDATEVGTVATIDGAPYILGAPYSTGGIHTFAVTATDEAGNSANATRSFTIDNEPPLVDDLTPVPGTVHAAFSIDIAGRVSDDAVEVTVGGVSAAFGGTGSGWLGWTAPSVPLEQDGLNLIALRAVDAAGNVTELELNYDRDTAAPQITLTTPEEGLITRFENLTVTGVATDAHLDRVTVNGVEVAFGADGSFSHPVVLVDGANTVTVTAIDVVLGETTVLRSVTLDTAPPVITVTQGGIPLIDGLVSAEPVSPVIAVDDATAVTLTITLNGAPFVSGTEVSSEGSYVLVVSAEDAAGNTASLERSFRLDLTPPALSGLSLVDGSVVANASPLLTGACDDAVTVTVNGQPAVITAGTFSFAGVALSEGANTITVIAADDVGNQSTVTINITLDTTGPALSVSAPVDGALVGEASVTVRGAAQDPHIESVTVAGRQAALAGSSFQVQVPLAQEGANVISLVAVDRAGNSSELTITVERDTTAPVLTMDEPGPSAILGSATVAVVGTVTDAHDVTVTIDSRSVTPGADGSFAIDLELLEGAHTLTAEATDEVGNRSSISREISVDLSAPELRITVPSAGAILAEAMVSVIGTVNDALGTDRVTVNGREAVLDGAGGFELADLALDEGTNTIVARAWDTAGNSGTRSMEVQVDTVAPSVVSTVPMDGTSAVPTTARPRIRFSEPIDGESLAGHVRLSREGQPLEVGLSLVGDGAEVDVAPASGLADNAEHVLEVDGTVTDRAGHPLVSAVSAAFTTVDSTPPQPPILDAIPSPACLTNLLVTGVAESESTVFATGDVHPSSVAAGADGSFALELDPAVGEGAIEIEVVAEDAAGNRSQPAYLVIELDCTPPQVNASEWDGDTTISVRFSEVIDEATVVVGDSVVVDGTVTPLAFTSTVTGATIVIELTAAPPAEELPLRLELSSEITDLAGNPATPYSQLFADPAAATFVAGEVFSDSNSVELAGARIILEEDGGPIAGDPPTVTADGRGRYQIPVVFSPVVIRVEADGYLPTWRRAVPIPGAATLLFDVRLSKRTDPVIVDSAKQLETPSARLSVDGASVPVEGFVLGFSPISEQGLPGLLPFGWRPLAATHVGLPEVMVLDPPAVLEFTISVPPEAVIARYDEASHAWVAEAFGGIVDVTSSATFAVLLPDVEPTSPGSAVIGSVLPTADAADAADPGEMTATLLLDPPVILPMETSLATVTAVPTTPAPSGHPVEVRLDEVLHVVGGGVLVAPPAAIDLFLYRQPDDTLAASFNLGASDAARRIALDEGVKTVNIRTLPDEVRTQDLVGPAGADVLSPEGIGLHVPEGALGRVIGVELAGQSLDVLPLALPAGLEAVAAANIGLGGEELTTPATLSFVGEGEPDSQYLLLSPVEVDGASHWRLIGLGALEGERIVCGPDQLDGLPAPGVVRAGLYVLARPAGEAWGLLTGTVKDIDSSPATEICLVSATGEIVQLTEGDGIYSLAAPAGTVDLSAEQLVSRNAGELVAAAAAGNLTENADIQLEVVPPRVVATSPVPNAEKVSTATPITVDFSEPLDLDPDNLWGIDVRVIAGPADQPGVGDLDLTANGTRLTWTPATSFPSASRISVTVDGNLRDLQGNFLEGGDQEFSFGVERYIGNEDIDESKIRLFVPGRDEQNPEDAVVEGDVGAVPSNIWMYIEDLDHDATVESFQATDTGVFSINLEMFDPDRGTGVQVGDRLRLHFLDSEDLDDELYVVELKPWLTIDGQGAFFNIDGGEFVTTDNVGISAPWGAFPDGGTLRVTKLPHTEVLPSQYWPSFAEARAAARIELTVEAARTVQLVIPGDRPDNPNTTMHACMRIEVAGRQHPMLMRTARWESTLGAYVTSPADDQPPENAAKALEKAAESGNPDPLLPGIRRSMEIVILEPIGSFNKSSKATDLRGRLLVTKGEVKGDVTINAMFLDASASVVYANTFYAPSDAALIAYDFGGAAKAYDDPTGGYAAMGIDEALAPGNGATVPLRPDDDFELHVTDPDTGYTHSERGYPPPTGGEFVDIPPSEAPGIGDQPLRIIGGTPFLLFSFDAAVGRTPLTHLIEVTREDLQSPVICRIPAGALPADRRIVLVNLKTGVQRTATTPQTGGAEVSLSLAAKIGEPVLLAVEPLLSSGDQELTLRFNRPVEGFVSDAHFQLLPVGDAGTNALELHVKGDTVRLIADPIWEVDERYDLRLTPTLFVALGSTLPQEPVDLPIKVAGVISDEPVLDSIVAEAELEGDVLLIAARDEGLKVYDISDPAAPVPLNTVSTVGGMAGVESDGFGNVVTLEGRVGQHVVLRLWSFKDLIDGGDATHLAEEALSQPLTNVGPGDIELEVFANSIDFTADAPPASVITVVPDAGGSWKSLTVSADLVSANHPVLLIDAVSGRVLWRGRAPAEGPLTIDNDLEIPDLPLKHPLRLRAHADTLIWAHAAAGPVIAANITFDGDGASDFSVGAVGQNADLLSWVRGAGGSGACRSLGPEDSVYLGRLAATPRRDGKSLLLAASRYEGIWGFRQTGNPDLSPDWLDCVRAAGLGSDLADIAAARIEFSEGETIVERDIVAVVGHRRLELFEAIDGRDIKKSANGIDLGWNPFRVAIDPVDRLILVRDNASHLAVFSLNRPGETPRMVADIVLPDDEAGLGPLVIDPDLGIAITGTSPVQYKPPRIDLVADEDGDGIPEVVEYLQPLGAPEAPAVGGQLPPYLAFVRARIVGVPDNQDSVAVRVEGLAPGGGVLPDRPEPFLPSSTVMTLHRPTGLPLDDPGRNWFVSEQPILLIADERARTDYWQNIDETLRDRLVSEDEANARYALCRNCDRDFDGDGSIDIPWSDVVDLTAPIELAAAGRIRVTFDTDNAPGWIADMLAAGMAPAAEAVSLPWMPSPPIGRDPGIEARAAMLPEVELATGALTLARTDLVLPAPGMDVVLGRRYSSAGIRYGLFGWGWELAGLERLRPNPDGTVDLQSSGGDRFVFGNSGGHPGANAKTLTSWGHPGELKRLSTGGWFLHMPSGAYTVFSDDGVPTVIRDRHRLKVDKGSELRFHWHADGTLAQIAQVNGTYSQTYNPRKLNFKYKDENNGGVISSVEDSAGRIYKYEYDEFGRLEEAKIEAIELAPENSSGDVVERYARLPAAPGDATPGNLEGGSLIDMVEEQAEPAVVRFLLDPTYDQTQMLHPITALSIGEIDFSVDLMTESQGTVTDADNVTELVTWDEFGRPRSVTVGGAQVTQIDYVPNVIDPLEDVVTLPSGGEIQNKWQVEEDSDSTRRSWFNLRETKKTRDTDDIAQHITFSNPADLTTKYDYEGVSNQPTVITLPPGPSQQKREWKIDRLRGEPTMITDPEGRETQFGIDDLGRRKTATDAASKVTKFEYDDPKCTGCAPTGSGELVKITGPAGTISDDVTRIFYDDFGNPTRVEHPLSNDHDSSAVEHTRRNKLGWVLQSWIDTYPNAQGPGIGDTFRTDAAYDLGGRLKTETRFTDNGVVGVEHFTTDAGLPDMDTITGGPQDPTIVNDYQYHPSGRLWQVLETTSGRSTTFLYDGLGRRRTRTVSASPIDLVTIWTYDRSDNLPTHIDLPGNDEVALSYDPFGRSNWQRDAYGRVTAVDLDGGGRAVITETSVGVDIVHWEAMDYNAADQPTSRTVRHYLPGTGSRNETTTYSYDDPADPRGQLYQVTDAEGRFTTFGYDGHGRQAMQELPDGTIISSTFWGSGQPYSTTEDPAGTEVPSYTTWRSYNEAGLLELAISPGGLETHYFYDDLGRMQMRLAPDNQDTIWNRSPLGAVTSRSQSGRAPVETRLDLGARRLTYEETASGAVFEATFDAAGRVLHQVDGNGVARDLQWNPDGTLDNVEVVGGTDPTATIIYGYDLGNRLRSINVAPATDLPGTERWPLSVDFDYDHLDNLTSASDDRGVSVVRTVWSSGEVATETLSVDGDTFVTAAAYDGTFLPEGMTYPDATSVVLGRDDPAGRLSSLTVNGAPTPMWSQQYAGLRRGSGGSGALATARSYDHEGRPQVVTAALGDSERFRLERGYNDASRYNTQTLRAGVSSVSGLTHDRAERTQSWRMDRSGTAGVDQVLGWAGPASGRVDNTFGGANGDRLATKAQYIDGEALLTVFGEPGSTYKLPSAGPWSYGYDLFGNRDEAASNVEVRGFRHDWSNRLLEVLASPNVGEPENSVAAFRYDPLGRRVAQIEGDLTTIRVPWGDQVIAEYVRGLDGETALRKRSYWGDGIDDLLVYEWDQDLDGTIESRFHPLTDAQGSVKAVATAGGLVVESYIYRPDGSFLIFGLDTTAPELVLARVRPADEAADREFQTIELLFTEQVQQAGGSFELRNGGGEVVADEAEPTDDPSRWTMALDPSLVEGDDYTLFLTGFQDLAGNAIAGEIEIAFSAPASTAELALPGTSEASFLAVIDGPDGLAFVSGAPIDPASVSSASVTMTRSGNDVAGSLALVDASSNPAWDGRVLLWTPDDPGAYLVAEYDATLNLALLDVSGEPIRGPPEIFGFYHHGEGDIAWSKPSEVPLLGGSQVGNDRFLHGRPYIASLGLYDHRARFYEPGTQLFLEPDPLGPVDSPNLYQAFGFDGMNVVDPWGMETKMIGLRAGRPILKDDQEIVVTAPEDSEPDSEPPQVDDSASREERDREASISERLESQPKIGQMDDVLVEGFVKPFIPCAESFSIRYARSQQELREGTSAGLMYFTTMGAKSRGGKWVANRVGTSTILKYSGRQISTGLRTFSLRAAGGAFASSTLGGLLVEPAFRIGIKAGSAINVQIVEPYTNPCRRAEYDEGSSEREE